MATQPDLHDVQFDCEVPTFLVRELTKRNCLPSWWARLASNRDWVASFHRTFTEDWPRHIREVAAGSIQTSLFPQAQVAVEGSMITFPIGTIALLHEVIEIVYGHLTAPSSSDLHAQMLLTAEGRRRAVAQLRCMIGRVRATNAPDCTIELPEQWMPGAVAAAHFMYCHELTHINHYHQSNSTTFFQDEFDADAHAQAFMSMTYRSHPLLQQVYSFVGPVIALALAAVREAAFPVDDWDRTHPRPADRVKFLRDRVETIEQGGGVPKGTATAGDAFWYIFSILLAEATAAPETIPDPVRELFLGSESIGERAVNLVLQWCAFGSVSSVAKSLARISLEDTLGKPADTPVIRHLLDEIKHLESNLGLARQLSLPAASPPPATRYTLIARQLLSEQLNTLPETPEEYDLMRMWMRVLFQALTTTLDAGDSVMSLLAEQSATDRGFVATVALCNDLVCGLAEEDRRERLCQEATEARVPRIAVLTTWLVEAIEQGRWDGVKMVDTYRPMRVGKLMVIFGFLLRRDAPEVVSLLLSEWTRRG